MKRIPVLIAVFIFVSANCFAADIEISPASVTLSGGAGSFTVNVRVENAAGLGGFQFDIDFDPNLAQISNINDVVVGNVFQSIANTNVLGPIVDNREGVLTFGAYTYDSPGVDGDYTLASVMFSVLTPANGSLTLKNVQFVDALGDAITVNAIGNAEIVFSGGSQSPAYTAVFEAGPNGTLEGQTSQTVSQGQSCSPITAVPDDGYEFSGWTGDYTGSENPLTLENVTGEMIVTANFIRKTTEAVTHTVTFIPGDHGGLSGVTEYTVNRGESLTPGLACVPDSGWRFAGWTGFDGMDCPPVISAVTADMAIRAEFEPITYTVAFTSGANGGLTGETTQTVAHGSDCSQVSAEPEEEYVFAGWTGDASGTENPLTIAAVTSDMSIHANFQPQIDDTDGDGVNDDQDDYPEDPQRATPVSSTGTGKILVDVSSTPGAYLTDVRALSDFDASLNQDGKPGGEFQDGMVSFTVNGASETAAVEITFPSGASGHAVYKADESGFYKITDVVFNKNGITLILENGVITVGIEISESGGGGNCFIESVF